MRWKMVLLAIASLFLFASCGDKDHRPTGSAPEEDVATAQANPEGWDLSQIVPLTSIRALPPGTKMTILTQLDGSGMRELQVELVAVINDIMPPIPYILLAATDPDFIAIGGVPAGGSGSPLTYLGRIIAALSFSTLFQHGEKLYFLATPLEYTIAGVMTRIPSAKPVKYQGMEFFPLATPMIGTGISPLLRQAVAAKFGDRTANQWLSGLGNAGKGSAQEKYEPGWPLAAAVVTGDQVNMAGTGTITYVDGDRFLALGHPLFWSGKLKLPTIGASVVTVITGHEGPQKVFTLYPEPHGALLVDGAAGVGGIFGNIEIPSTALVLNFRLANGETKRFEHRLYREGVPVFDQVIATTLALFSPAVTLIDNVEEQSVRITSVMRFLGTDDLVVDRTRLYAKYGVGIQNMLTGTAFDDFINIYLGTLTHPDANLSPERIELSISIIDSALYASVDTAYVDSVANIGAPLKVDVNLRVGRTHDQLVSFELAIPDTFPAGKYSLSIVPGPEDQFKDKNPEGEIGWTSKDPSLNEVVAKLNLADPQVLLSVHLELAAPDMPAVPDMPADSLMAGLLDSLAVVPDSLSVPPLPPMFNMPKIPTDASVTDSRNTGFVLSGGLKTVIHLKKGDDAVVKK